MKTVILSLALAASCPADMVRFTGTVTEVVAGTEVQVGDTFVAWLPFHIYDIVNNYAVWEPQAVEFRCPYISDGWNCTTDQPTRFSVYVGGPGVHFSSGLTFSASQYHGDFAEASIASNLSVIRADTGLSPLTLRSSGGTPSFPSFRFVSGTSTTTVAGNVESASFVRTPEPSAFVLAAPVLLLGFWQYRKRGYLIRK